MSNIKTKKRQENASAGTHTQAASRMRALRSMAGMFKRTPLTVDPQLWVNALRAEDGSITVTPVA